MMMQSLFEEYQKKMNFQCNWSMTNSFQIETNAKGRRNQKTNEAVQEWKHNQKTASQRRQMIQSLA